ncbi:MAG TPA: efflux RND transporter permease subunit, partial [Candidatus Aminicenantes bacterium]|nr:efflux RND transporter permease subunit [Candidatus Aminicenantes bacterium]
LGVVLLGFISLKHLRVDLLPDLGYPKLSVVTEYLGASSGEVESLVTTHLEASLSPIPGLRRVSSVSREGVSLVTLEFHWGTDMNFALLHTKEKVEEARSLLPEDCPAPRLIELDPGAKPIVIAVLGVRPGERRTLAELRETAESLVKPRLEQLAGVSKVDVQGGGEREVAVVLDPSKLALYHIGYDQVAKAIQDWNQVVLGGTVKRDKVRYVVKVEGEIPRVEDLASIPVDTGGQAPLTIGDLGRARLAEKVRQGDIRFAGRSTVALMVYKESSSNTVQACAEVRKACAAMEREFPDLRFHTVSEEAGLILSAVANLKQSLIQGGFLAFLVLLIFFQNLRDPILVVLISPISILATFALMYFSGITLNIMSLGGLALGVGMFMDNAIVVIENMFRLERQGDPETAAIAGTRELMPALLGSTLTTMVIFLPVIYIYGISGRLFRDQSLTICYALTVALVVTVTLLPSLFHLLSAPNRAPLPAGEPEGAAGNRWLRVAHGLLALPFRLLGFVLTTTGGAVAWLAGRLRHGLDRALRRPLGFVCRGFNREYERFAAGYHRFLVRCLEQKSIAAWITLAMFAGALGFYLLLKKELLPPTSSDRFEVMVTTRAGQGYE